ncbi:zinc ribbon domain-containing protein [Ruminococcus flavefaciens]|uniref:zinc ribbon domain-containing protein n=2 Tax=Ruminococcus flavefaciens TaxID=1265 RepID=UPI0004BC4C12|nr:zinc ribbon domain-containing protein [Ruminococcus flavefaciens]
MKCNKCGSEMTDDALFCTECGAPLEHTETADIFVDDEPTSILPHLEEVIADNEEALSLTQEQADMLGDEPAEILSSGAEDTITIPEPVVIPEPSPIPPAETSFDKPYEPLNEEQVPEVPVNGAPDSFNDNSSTMKIPVQNEPFSSYNAHANQFPSNEAPQPDTGAVPYQKPPVQTQQTMVPPQQEPAAPAPMPVQNESKPKARAKVGGGRIFGASLVTIFTMLFLLLFSLILAVKIGANGSIIRKRFEKLNADATLTAEFDGKEMSKTLYDSMGFRTATRGTADEASFKNYLLDTDFREYAGGAAEKYLDYIIDGEGKDPSVSSEDFVNDFIKGNKEAAAKNFDYEFTDNDYDLMQKNLDKDNFSDTMSVKEWSRKAGFDMDKLSYAFSYITIGVLAAFFLLFLVWTAAVLKKRARYVTGFFGTTFTVVGFIVFLAGLVLIVGSAVAFTFTNNVCFYLTEHLLLPLSLLLLMIGGVELIFGFIFRKTKKRLKKKEKKAAAAAAQAIQ